MKGKRTFAAAIVAGLFNISGIQIDPALETLINATLTALIIYFRAKA